MFQCAHSHSHPLRSLSTVARRFSDWNPFSVLTTMTTIFFPMSFIRFRIRNNIFITFKSHRKLLRLAYFECFPCFRFDLLPSLVVVDVPLLPSFTCFQMVVLLTSSVILIGFVGIINNLALASESFSVSPG